MVTMFNIMSWNCRGVGARHFPLLIPELNAMYKIHVLILVEPRISELKAERIINKLGYNNSFRVEA